MAWSGYSFGVEYNNGRKFNVIEDGVCIGAITYPTTHTGGYVAISGRKATASIGRFAAYDRVGGTLLWEDEFADLSAWTLGHNGGNWSASGGKARIAVGGDDLSSVIVRPMLGARYFEASDVSFDNTDTDDRWLMITIYKAGLGRTDNPNTGGPGDDGYRVLVRQHPDDRSSFWPDRTEKSIQTGSTSGVLIEDCQQIITGWKIGVVPIGPGAGFS